MAKPQEVVEKQPITDKHTYRFGRGGMLGVGYVGPQWFADLMVRITSTYDSLNITYVTTRLSDGREVLYPLGNPNLITRRRRTKGSRGEGDAEIHALGRGFSYREEFGPIVSARIALGGKELIVRKRPNNS